MTPRTLLPRRFTPSANSPGWPWRSIILERWCSVLNTCIDTEHAYCLILTMIAVTWFIHEPLAELEVHHLLPLCHPRGHPRPGSDLVPLLFGLSYPALDPATKFKRLSSTLVSISPLPKLTYAHCPNLYQCAHTLKPKDAPAHHKNLMGNVSTVRVIHSIEGGLVIAESTRCKCP